MHTNLYIYTVITVIFDRSKNENQIVSHISSCHIFFSESSKDTLERDESHGNYIKTDMI